MKEHIETVREALESIIRRVALVSPYYEAARDAQVALAKIEAEHERVGFIGKVTPCPNCDGSGEDSRGSACCRIPGHARGCECAVCQWMRASYRNESEANVLRARVEQQSAALHRIADSAVVSAGEGIGTPALTLNAYWHLQDIARAALAAPEQKEPAQPPLPTWAEVRKVLEPFARCTARMQSRPNNDILVALGGNTARGSIRVSHLRAIAALLSRIPEGE